MIIATIKNCVSDRIFKSLNGIYKKLKLYMKGQIRNSVIIQTDAEVTLKGSEQSHLHSALINILTDNVFRAQESPRACPLLPSLLKRKFKFTLGLV